MKYFLLILILTSHSIAYGKPPINSHEVINNQTVLIDRIEKGLTQSELDIGLAFAAGINNVKAGVSLLNAGANPNKNIFSGHTAVVIAVRENNPEILKLLLKNGGDPNVSTQFEWKPLHHAVSTNYSHIQVIKLLLENGANINAMDSLQRTVLHRAAGFGHEEAVKYLISKNANKKLKEKYNKTAYDRALAGGHSKILKYLK